MPEYRVHVPLAELVAADEGGGFGIDGRRPERFAWGILSGRKSLINAARITGGGAQTSRS
jgi:hypothetical protein